MSVRGGQGPREPMVGPAPSSGRHKNGYQRTGQGTSADSRITATGAG